MNIRLRTTPSQPIFYYAQGCLLWRLEREDFGRDGSRSPRCSFSRVEWVLWQHRVQQGRKNGHYAWPPEDEDRIPKVVELSISCDRHHDSVRNACQYETLWILNRRRQPKDRYGWIIHMIHHSFVFRWRSRFGTMERKLLIETTYPGDWEFWGRMYTRELLAWLYLALRRICLGSVEKSRRWKWRRRGNLSEGMRASIYPLRYWRFGIIVDE